MAQWAGEYSNSSGFQALYRRGKSPFAKARTSFPGEQFTGSGIGSERFSALGVYFFIERRSQTVRRLSAKQLFVGSTPTGVSF